MLLNAPKITFLTYLFYVTLIDYVQYRILGYVVHLVVGDSWKGTEGKRRLVRAELLSRRYISNIRIGMTMCHAKPAPKH